mmetsp:Transcript_235/g.593  ORF Transcript_235/g.593 Transcript_235/m.593 type:complete len:108 (-) Transcript_235:1421-1744(-)
MTHHQLPFGMEAQGFHGRGSKVQKTISQLYCAEITDVVSIILVFSVGMVLVCSFWLTVLHAASKDFVYFSAAGDPNKERLRRFSALTLRQEQVLKQEKLSKTISVTS